MNKKIIVFGGDGFCGWPTSLFLSNLGYEVLIVDNLSRRKIDIDLECESLTPIQSLSTRTKAWQESSMKNLHFEVFDIAKNYHRTLTLLKNFNPCAVVHFAEQRSAPFSMKSSLSKRYTVNNNINATNNLLCAIVESGLDIHLIHLGSTGVYGYGTVGMEIPEGYLDVFVKTNYGYKDMKILYPAFPGSVYHMTKNMDALMFNFFNKNDSIRITDLHQGIVWGTQTEETMKDDRLINRFDYDGDYGTVLNRFIMQAALGHPLTVHGTGGQTRAFIHIKDTVNCIKLAIENPPLSGDVVKIFNQTTEQHNVLELAKKISSLTGSKIKFYVNPRKEDPSNDLKLCSESFKKLGLNPTYLNDGLLEEIFNVAGKYKNRCNLDKILCKSVWKKTIPIDEVGSEKPIYSLPK